MAACILYWRFRPRVAFPRVEKSEILFREAGVSGSWSKSIWTRLWTLKDVFEVLVVRNEIWIRPCMPYSIIVTGAEFGMRRRISIGDRERIESKKRLLRKPITRLAFRNSAGASDVVEIELSDPEAFTSAVGRLSPIEAEAVTIR